MVMVNVAVGYYSSASFHSRLRRRMKHILDDNNNKLGFHGEPPVAHRRSGGQPLLYLQNALLCRIRLRSQ